MDITTDGATGTLLAQPAFTYITGHQRAKRGRTGVGATFLVTGLAEKRKSASYRISKRTVDQAGSEEINGNRPSLSMATKGHGFMKNHDHIEALGIPEGLGKIGYINASISREDKAMRHVDSCCNRDN